MSNNISEININISGGATKFGNIVQGDGNIITDKNKINYPLLINCKIFISYRRSDSSNISGRIYDSLTRKLGEKNVFKDVYSIPPGENFKTYIENEISKAGLLLAIIGENWLGGKDSISKIKDPQDFVRLEIEAALKKNTPIIPVFTSGAAMPTENELPKELKDFIYINGIKIREDPDFKNDFNYLFESIKKIAEALKQ